MLNEYPEIEVVQIQLNYIDFEDPAVQARLCYEVCRKHNKPVIVMEPVRGGKLADVPEQGKAIFDALHGGSPASYAIRYAADFDGVIHGALRHEQLRADERQPVVYEGL